jgi:hypothetical protein
MGTLLGHLAHFGSLSTQAELLCTQGLAFLLQNAAVRAALAAKLNAATSMQLREDLI